MRRPVGPGRPRKEGEILSIERPIKFAPSMYEKLKAHQEQSGVSIAEQVRRAVEKSLSAEPAPPPPQPAHIRTIDLGPDAYQQLSALSKSLGIKNLDDFIEHLTTRALAVKPAELKSFFYGGIFDGEEEEVAALAAKKPATPVARRAA